MKQLSPSERRPDVYERLAARLRTMVHQEHVNELSGTERFTVLHVAPLRIEHFGSDLILVDGDPDFAVGAWLRQFMLNYTLAVGDVVWCLREGQQWHMVDVEDPGAQSAWRPGP